MPAPTQATPRCSRTPCHTSHAPPISATAAATKSRSVRATDIAETLPTARARPAGPGAAPRSLRPWSPRAPGTATPAPAGPVGGPRSQRLGEVERPDGEGLAVIEAVGVVAVGARVEVEDGAAGGAGSGLELGEQRPPDPRGPMRRRRDQVVDV